MLVRLFWARKSYITSIAQLWAKGNPQKAQHLWKSCAVLAEDCAVRTPLDIVGQKDANHKREGEKKARKIKQKRQ